MNKEIEKIIDTMYAALEVRLISISNKAGVIDILSEALYKAGYRQPSTEVLSDGQHLIQVSVTRKEMLAMPKVSHVPVWPHKSTALGPVA